MPAKYLRTWMRGIMNEHHWTAQQWAREAGTTPTNITRFVKGSSHIPSYVTLVKLAHAAGVNIPTPPRKIKIK